MPNGWRCPCSVEPAYAASIPSMRACPECGFLEVEIGRTWMPLPGCPRCRGQLSIMLGELPISVGHHECGQFFYFDTSGSLYARSDPSSADSPRECPTCSGGLVVSESLPPRGECRTCAREYLLDPLQPVAPCARCAGVIRVAEGMPPAGVCAGCGHRVVLRRTPKPLRTKRPHPIAPSSAPESSGDESKEPVDWDWLLDMAVNGAVIAFGLVVALGSFALLAFMFWFVFFRR